MRRALIYSPVLVLLVFGLACSTPAISQRVQALADQQIQFPELRADPGKYQGKMIILGGEVDYAQTTTDGATLIKVREKELDRDLRPVHPNVYRGSFYVKCTELHPDEFKSGRKITVAGAVVEPMKDLPVIEAKRIHLWQYPYHVTVVPRDWFDDDPQMQYWFSAGYFNPCHKGQFGEPGPAQGVQKARAEKD